ncbi:MAG: SIMPL domain-containing protein [Candidatus Paceibacterota bacterium]
MSGVDYKKLVSWLGVLVLVLVAFVGVKTVNEIKAFRYIGADSFSENNSISVSGEGEVFATADIANFSFSVVESGDTVGEAEEAATIKWNEILAYLEDEGVEDRDVKTVNYMIEPQYAPQAPNVNWVPLVEREIVGYIVTQAAEVKVRETSTTGELLSTVGDMGVRNLSGISFTIDDEDELYAEARALAIADAKEKAEELASSLGISLGRVVGFYESGVMPYPYMAKDERAMSQMQSGMGGDMVITPEIPMGENRIVVNVEVMYRIR